jgi:hypothetical protein
VTILGKRFSNSDNKSLDISYTLLFYTWFSFNRWSHILYLLSVIYIHVWYIYMYYVCIYMCIYMCVYMCVCILCMCIYIYSWEYNNVSVMKKPRKYTIKFQCNIIFKWYYNYGHYKSFIYEEKCISSFCLIWKVAVLGMNFPSLKDEGSTPKWFYKI